MYWPLGENMTDITSSITNCGNPCTLEGLAERSEIYKPTPDINTVGIVVKLFRNPCIFSFATHPSSSHLLQHQMAIPVLRKFP